MGKKNGAVERDKIITVYEKDQVLFSGCDEHLEEAKKYIQDNNLTSDDVRIVRNYKGIKGIDVVTKKEIKI